MRDLADVYVEARFGKAAAADAVATDPKGVKAYLTMPQLTEQTLAIRNAIEESVRREQRLKAKAKALAEYARRRVSEAPQAGFTGQVSDIARAMVPGLSPAASTESIEKTGGVLTYTTPEAEKKYDIAHILAAGGGAGLGAMAQRGLLGAGSSEQALQRLIEAARGAGASVTGLPSPAAAAPAGTLRGILGTLKSVLKLKGVPTAAAQRSQILARAAGRGRGLGGGKGALIGAALVSLPFALRRWWINRQMRARGGRAAAEAATTAEANIAAAQKLQAWRQKQLAQLEEAVGPGAPTWTPPVPPVAPGPAPAPAPTPGPFGRYQLTPFQQ